MPARSARECVTTSSWVVDSLGDLGHVVLEFGRHAWRGDMRCICGERIDDGHAQTARLAGVVLEILPLVERVYDRGARGLGSQSETLHLLDEPGLAVARGGFGLLGIETHLGDVARITLGKCGEKVVLPLTIGIDGLVAGLHEHRSRCREGLARDVEAHLRVIGHRDVHERGEEAPRNEVVELPLGRLEVIGIRRCRGVDGRVVGVFGLAPRGMEPVLAEDLLAGRRVLRHRGERTHATTQVKRGGVHGVVHARVRDETAHVEALGETHGPGGRDALRGGSGLERGGVETGRAPSESCCCGSRR